MQMQKQMQKNACDGNIYPRCTSLQMEVVRNDSWELGKWETT